MGKQNPNSYYEAILQLRNPNKELINCVLNALKKNKSVFISKEVSYKNGADFYISSQKFAHQLGKTLKKSFKKGELIESKKLHSCDRQSSRLVYRRTVLFRL